MSFLLKVLCTCYRYLKHENKNFNMFDNFYSMEFEFQGNIWSCAEKLQIEGKNEKLSRWHSIALHRTPKDTGSFSNNVKEYFIKLDFTQRSIIQWGKQQGSSLSLCASIDKMIPLLSFMLWLFSFAFEEWIKYKEKIVSIWGKKERCTLWVSMEETLQLAPPGPNLG